MMVDAVKMKEGNDTWMTSRRRSEVNTAVAQQLHAYAQPD